MSEVIVQGDLHMPIFEIVLDEMVKRRDAKKRAPRQIRFSESDFAWFLKHRHGGPWWVPTPIDDPTSVVVLTPLGRVEITFDERITNQHEMRYDEPTDEDIRERAFDPIAIATDGSRMRIRNSTYGQAMTIDVKDLPALLVALDWAQEQFK